MNEKYEAQFLREFKENVLETLNQIRREPFKYKFGQYRSGTAAPEYLRSRMDSRFHSMPLDMIRDAVHSSSSKVVPLPGKQLTKKPAIERVVAIATRDGRHLSPEYIAYIDSDEWKARAARHRKEAEWHCQVCGRLHGNSSTLDVHHNTYGAFDGNEPAWSLIAVCHDDCHPVCDMLRRSKSRPGEYDDDDGYLFTLKPEAEQKCDHGEECSECNDCMVESDFMFDVHRENSFFG